MTTYTKTQATAAVSTAPQVHSVRGAPEPPAAGNQATTSTDTLAMLGVTFDAVTAEQAMDRVDEMIAARTPHYIVTPNVDFLVQAGRDRELHRILLEADLVLTDGAPLLWMSRWLRRPFPERVAGSDIVPRLLRRAESRGYRVFFLGGQETIGQQAVERIRRTHPGLAGVDHYSPPFADLLHMDQEEIQERIRQANPDLLFVCFGCPKQEKWIAMNHRQVGVPVCMGVGATIDFLAGHISRAPRWMRRAGLEWAYRLGHEPRRLFQRYLDDFRVFLPAATRQLWRMGRVRPGPGRDAHAVSGTVSGDASRLRLEGVVDADQVNQAVALASGGSSHARRTLLDLSGTSHLTSAGIGGLVRWRTRLRACGGELVLLAPSPAVREALGLMNLTEVFFTATDADGLEGHMPARFRAEGPRVAETNGHDVESVMTWHGEVTASEVDAVWKRFVLDFERRPARSTRLVLDLSGVRFMDSSGIGLLLRAQKHAARAAIRLTCDQAQPAVLNVLELTHTRQRLLGA